MVVSVGDELYFSFSLWSVPMLLRYIGSWWPDADFQVKYSNNNNSSSSSNSNFDCAITTTTTTAKHT